MGDDKAGGPPSPFERFVAAILKVPKANIDAISARERAKSAAKRDAQAKAKGT
jgi:hypothetical protein